MLIKFKILHDEWDLKNNKYLIPICAKKLKLIICVPVQSLNTFAADTAFNMIPFCENPPVLNSLLDNE